LFNNTKIVLKFEDQSQMSSKCNHFCGSLHHNTCSQQVT